MNKKALTGAAQPKTDWLRRIKRFALGYFPHSKKKKKKPGGVRQQARNWVTHGIHFLDLNRAKRVGQLLLLLVGDLCSIDSSNIISLANVCFQGGPR